MVTIEGGKSKAENISERSETMRVQQQIKEELKALTKDVNKENNFYKIEGDDVTYNMNLVKGYLTSLKGKSWKELQEKNASARVMAVQIALESQKYEVGAIDGIFKTKWKETSRTMQAVEKFQKDYNLKHKDEPWFQKLVEDWLPGPKTISALLEGLPTEASSDAAVINQKDETPSKDNDNNPEVAAPITGDYVNDYPWKKQPWHNIGQESWKSDQVVSGETPKQEPENNITENQTNTEEADKIPSKDNDNNPEVAAPKAGDYVNDYPFEKQPWQNGEAGGWYTGQFTPGEKSEGKPAEKTQDKSGKKSEEKTPEKTQDKSKNNPIGPSVEENLRKVEWSLNH